MIERPQFDGSDGWRVRKGVGDVVGGPGRWARRHAVALRRARAGAVAVVLVAAAAGVVLVALTAAGGAGQ